MSKTLHDKSSIDQKSEELLIEFILSAYASKDIMIDDGADKIIKCLRELDQDEKFVFRDLEQHDVPKSSLASERMFDSETVNRLKKIQPRPTKPFLDLVTFITMFSTLAVTSLIILPIPYSYAMFGVCTLSVFLGIALNRKKNVRYRKH